MKRVIIANPNAGSGKVKRHWDKISHDIQVSIGVAEGRFTTQPGDATRMVKDALLEGVDQVVVVGGDGSVNEAINGWFDENGSAYNPDASMVVYPHGTGGDFARSIGISGSNLSSLFLGASDKLVDVGVASGLDHQGQPFRRYFLNISSFGSSGVISNSVNQMTRVGKILGGKAAYAIGTVRGLATYRNRRIRLRIDDTYEQELVVSTVAVANGRYFGGSMKVAPGAFVDDGFFDVVVMGDINLAYFLKNNGKLYRGEHLDSPGFSMIRGKKVVATPIGHPNEVLMETDGETPGRLPVTYEIMPGALKLFAPWGHAEAIR